MPRQQTIYLIKTPRIQNQPVDVNTYAQDLFNHTGIRAHTANRTFHLPGEATLDPKPLGAREIESTLVRFINILFFLGFQIGTVVALIAYCGIIESFEELTIEDFRKILNFLQSLNK